MASNLKAFYIVGAGTAVIRNIENEATAAENPAKMIKGHIPEKQGGDFTKRIIRSVHSVKMEMQIPVWHRRVA